MFQNIELSKSAWHYRLQVLYFKEADYTNFCPYFWLTIFCVLTFPVIGIPLWIIRNGPDKADQFLSATLPFWKIIGRGFEAMMNGILWFLDTFLCDPVETQTLKHVDDEALVNLYRHSRDFYMKECNKTDPEIAKMVLLSHADSRQERKLFARMDAKFQKWKKLAGGNWENILKAAETRYWDSLRKERDEQKKKQAESHEAKYAREQEKKAAAAKRRQMMNSIVKWTKPVAYTIVAGLVAIPLCFLGKLLKKVNWIAVWNTLISIPVALWHGVVQLWVLKWVILGWTTFGAVSVFLIVAFIVKIEKCDLGFARKVGGAVSAFFDLADSAIHYTAAPFIAFGMFLWEYFKMFKANHCPQIQWID